MAAVAGYLLWTGADHNRSEKRGGECILIYANGLTGCDVETINGRSACGVIRRCLQTSEGQRLSVLAFHLRKIEIVSSQPCQTRLCRHFLQIFRLGHQANATQGLVT